MAEKENNAPAAEATEGQDVAPAGGNKKKKLLIILIAVVLVLAGGGAAAYFFLLSGEDAAEEVASETPAGEPQKAPAIYYEIEKPFIINFNVDNRQRYLQISVSIMSREQEVIDAMAVHLPVISNRLVMLFSAAEFAALQTSDGREKLQKDTLTAVQDVLQNEIGKPGVEQVYFTGFVLQ